MATILGRQTLNGVDLLNVDADPSAGPGTPAAVGSFALVSTTGTAYTKTGALDTDWTSVGASVSSGGRIFLLEPGSPPSGSRYDTWASVYAAATATPGASTIVVNSAGGVPIVGAGVWDLTNIKLSGSYAVAVGGNGPRDVLEFDTGSVVTGLNSVEALKLRNVGTTTPFLFSDPFNWLFGRVSLFESASGTPLIEVADGTTVVAVLGPLADLVFNAGPVIQFNGVGSGMFVVSQGTFIAADTFSGTVGGILVFSRDGSDSISTAHSGLTGVVSVELEDRAENHLYDDVLAPPLVNGGNTNVQEAIDALKGLQGSSEAITFSVNQVGHGFSVLQALTHDGAQFNLAQANSAATLGYWTVIEVLDVDNFRVAYSGRISIPAHGLTPGDFYFVSSTVAGSLTVTEPTTIGNFSNPLVYCIDANVLHFLPFRPSEITASTASIAWLLDGNTNGAERTIGTNDAFDFVIETTGTEKVRVDAATGDLTLQGELINMPSNIGIGTSPSVGGGQTIAIGENAVATSGRALAIGRVATVSGGLNSESIAIGSGASVAGTTGGNSVALGRSATVTGAGNSTVVGSDSSSSGLGGVAIGSLNTVSGTRGVAIGSFSSATQSGSVAIGWDADSVNVESVALGRSASTTADNQFMVGDSSAELNTIINGTLTATSSVAESLPVGTFTTSGAGGDSIGLFVGTSAPNGAITGDAGSLFLRDEGTTGQLWINTSTGSGTTWEQIASASSLNLQGAYDGSPSTNRTIVLAAGAGEGINVRDNAAPLGSNLFEVTDNAGTTEYLAVDATGVTIDGKLTVTGLIDPTGLVLVEQASDPASTSAGEGTLWVRDDAPNVPMFTDDTGADWQLAGPGTSAQVVYRPGGVPEGNVYTTWSDAHAAAAAFPGLATLRVDSSLGTATVTAGAWDMTNILLSGFWSIGPMGPTDTLNIADGATFTNIDFIYGPLSIISASTSPIITITSDVNFVCRLGVFLASTTAPMIEVSPGVNFTLTLMASSFLFNLGSELVNVTDPTSNLQINLFDTSQVSANTLTGTAGAVIVSVNDPSNVVDTTQSITPALSVTLQSEANLVSYDNSTSGLSATQVQAAIDELSFGSEAISFPVNQVGHGFSVLNAISHNGSAFILAQANNASTLGYWLVSEVIDPDNFVATYAGQVEIGGHGLSVGSFYYVSPFIPGLLDPVEPTTIGEFSNPLLYVRDGNLLQVLAFRPSEVTATGPVDLQVAYDNGPSITTSAIQGALSVSGTEGIFLFAEQTSIFEVLDAELNLSTSNTGNLNVTAADDLILQGGSAPTGVGNLVSITAGNGFGSNDGGAISILGGFSGGGTTGDGGDINIIAGGVLATVDGNGGRVVIDGRDGFGTGNGGDIVMTPGVANGTGTDGVVLINGKLTVTGLIDPTGLVIEEQNTRPFDPTATTEALLWVRDDSPNILVYTDNDGNDWDIGGSGIQGLAGTLVSGNVTGGTDIVVSSGDEVVGESGGPTGGDLTLRAGPGTTPGTLNLLGALAASTTSPGGPINIRSGDSGSAGNVGGALDIRAGDGFLDGGQVTVDGGSSFSALGGDIWLRPGEGPGGNGRVVLLPATGTAAVSYANAAEVYTATADPSVGGIAAPVSSLLHRDAGGLGTVGELWLKTGATNTDWVQVQTGSADTLAQALVAGNTTGGTNMVFSPGDQLLGETANVGGDLEIFGGSGSVTTGGDVSISGGTGNTDGGEVSVTGGTSGPSGDGGDLTLSGGSGTATPGAVRIGGGFPGTATTNGGAVVVEGRDSGGFGGLGGAVTVESGSGFSGGANLTLRSGDGFGGGSDGGDVRIFVGSGTASPGEFQVTNPGGITTPIVTYTTLGADGDSAEVYVGELDPSVGGGVPASVGSLLHRDVGGNGVAGEVWIKTGAANTAWSQIESVSGAPVSVAGTTVDPTAPAAFAVLPEMTVSFTPRGTQAWVNFDSSVRFDPAGPGDSIYAEFQVTVNGVPVAGSLRRAGCESASIASLIPGEVLQLVSFRRLLTGLTPGASVTIAIEWREALGVLGTATARGTERSLTVEDV